MIDDGPVKVIEYEIGGRRIVELACQHCGGPLQGKPVHIASLPFCARCVEKELRDAGKT